MIQIILLIDFFISNKFSTNHPIHPYLLIFHHTYLHAFRFIPDSLFRVLFFNFSILSSLPIHLVRIQYNNLIYVWFILEYLLKNSIFQNWENNLIIFLSWLVTLVTLKCIFISLKFWRRFTSECSHGHNCELDPNLLTWVGI